MELGIALEGIRPVAELVRLAARVEALGFDSLWTPDHVVFSQPICDPFQVLAACAAATSRIRLGTCVLLLPLRHPTHVAKQASSLDWFCGGEIADPNGLLEGTGKFMRHVKLSPERDVDAAALTKLIETAYAEIKVP